MPPVAAKTPTSTPVPPPAPPSSPATTPTPQRTPTTPSPAPTPPSPATAKQSVTPKVAAAAQAAPSPSSQQEDTNLAPDQVVDEWRVIDKLGEGGFGAVYRVANSTTNEELAMKVESKKEEDSMVQVEAIVLKILGNRNLLKHACKFYGDGETPTFRYIVMQLLGRSLSELRKATPNQRFSANTTMRIGMQCLDAIETLHKIGFLHRDVKPGNFAMGRGDADKRTVFLLDYGLCRQYITREGQLRPARKVAGFCGTVRYASVNVHTRKEQGRHDDLWSLLYMLVEFRSGELPWRKLHDKDEVMKKKQETPVSELFECVSEPEFNAMHDTLKGLQYKDTPNYTWFHLQLRAIASRSGFKEDQPFDWEPGGEFYDSCCKTPSPKKKKKPKHRTKEKQPGEPDGSGRVEGEGEAK